jgi:hypothetical protein
VGPSLTTEFFQCFHGTLMVHDPQLFSGPDSKEISEDVIRGPGRIVPKVLNQLGPATEIRIISEIKPCIGGVPTRFAIRLAVGQLLEHQFRHDKDAHLEIVLDRQPQDDEIHFCESLGIGLMCPNAKGFRQLCAPRSRSD